MSNEISPVYVEMDETPGILRIGWDMDGVIDDLAVSEQKYIGDPLGFDIHQSPSLVIYDYSLKPPIVAQNAFPFVQECFKNPQFYRDAKPIWPMIHLINKLHLQGHKQSIITARFKNELQRVTYEELEEYGLPWLIPDTHFVEFNHGQRMAQKRAIASKLGLHIYTDDHGPTVLAMTADTLMAKIMVDYPHNSEHDANGRYQFEDKYTHRVNVNRALETAEVIDNVSRAHFLHYSVPLDPLHVAQ